MHLNIHNFSLDIWDLNKNPGVNGYTQEIGGICSEKKHSVIEWRAFNLIFIAAHELGHRYI
jgi:hypothetical protein